MQNVPTTCPFQESTGFDQEARSPCFNAEARCSGTSHSGSVAMSETITAEPRYAAVPHEPAHGPIGISSICRVHSFGRFGPAATSKCTPSAFSNKTEASVSGRCSSMIKHNAFRICFSGTPVAIISSSRFSPASKASARLRWLISRRIAWKYPPRIPDTETSTGTISPFLRKNFLSNRIVRPVFNFSSLSRNRWRSSGR